MNLRKLFAILLALLVVLSFAACDGGGGGSSDNGGDTPAPVPPAPLCFTASGGDVEVGLRLIIESEPDAVVNPSLEWSSDGEIWNSITINTTKFDDIIMPVEGIQRAPVIKTKTATTYITHLDPGAKMYIKAAGTNDSFYKDDKAGRSFIRFYFKGREGATVVASGNIMSLLDNTRALTEISAPHCFHQLFFGCDILTKAPELPATTLTANCYEGMFHGCQMLKEAPVLPATTLAENCYYAMFGVCLSLTKAPELPATELVPGCYLMMFAGCRSLEYIKVGFTSWGSEEDECTDNWVVGVSADGNFECPEPLYNEALKRGPGDNTIPEYWTVNGKAAEWMME